MKGIKGFLMVVALGAVAALVAHAPAGDIVVRIGLGLLGVVALDALSGALYGSFAAFASAGSQLGQILQDKPFRKYVLDKWAALGMVFHHESNEEIQHAIERTGRVPKLHSYGGGGNPFTSNAQPVGGVEGRIEENYLYSTRRFPLNTVDNTVGTVPFAAQDYNFFTSGVGDPATAMGYFSLTNLTYVQTNMAPSGKIPNGRGFKLFDLGVSFNAQAVAADIAQLLDVCSLSFQKQAGQLVVYHGPLQLWPGGVGIAGFGAAATTVAATTINVGAATNGLPNLANMRRSRNPRILSANDDFRYVVSALASTPRSNTAVSLSEFVEMRIAMYGFVLDRIPN